MSTDAPHDPELEALTSELDALFDAAPSPAADAALADLKARAAALAHRDHPQGAYVQAEVLFCEGVRALARGDDDAGAAAFRAAIPHAERALALAPDDVRRRDRLASLHYNLGNVQEAAGECDAAAAAFRAALPLLEANARDRPAVPYARNRVAQTEFNLGNARMGQRRFDEAAVHFRAARARWSALSDEDPACVAYAHDLARSDFNLAYVVSQTAPTPEAFEAYERAEAIWERLLGDDGGSAEQRCDLARGYFNHSALLAQAGRGDEALARLEQALQHFDRLVALGPRHAQSAHYARLRAQARERYMALLGPHPERALRIVLADADARAAAARAADDWRALKQVGTGLAQQAAGFCAGKRPIEMEQCYRAATGYVAEAAPSDPTPDTAHLEAALWFDLNVDLRAQRLADGAELAVRTALARWTALRARAPDDPRFAHWVAGARNNLGILHANTGRLHSAEVHYGAALEAREAVARARPGDLGNLLFLGGVLCNLGNMHRDRGEFTAARALYDRALGVIEPLQVPLARNGLVAQFVANSRAGLAACAAGREPTPERLQSATIAWGMPGPPALAFALDDAALRAELERVDALRRAGDERDRAASAALVARAPHVAEAWLLRGLILGHFRTAQGAPSVPWHDAEHLEATAAFYEAEVLRPGWYEARLYRARALVQAAHAAQARLHAIAEHAARLDETARTALLGPHRARLTGDYERAVECLEGAARLRPDDGAALADLAQLRRDMGRREAD